MHRSSFCNLGIYFSIEMRTNDHSESKRNRQAPRSKKIIISIYFEKFQLNFRKIIELLKTKTISSCIFSLKLDTLVVVLSGSNLFFVK